MKKLVCLILLLFALQPLVHGQFLDSISPIAHNRMSLQVLTGTQGLGINFRYLQDETVGFRIGGSYGSAGINDQVKMDGFNPKNRTNLKFNTVQVLAEFMPQKSFRVVAGGAYLAKAEALINFSPKDPNITSPPQEILDFKMDWGGYVAPYLGLGLGRGMPKNRFNVNIDLGAYYLHPPKVKGIGDQSIIDRDKNAAIIENNSKGYRLMPVAQLNFNFKLSRKP